MRPVLSIAIPTYNRRDLLEYCLDKVLKEFNDFDYPFEVIVSDNCSTDSTCEMVESRFKSNPNIKLFRKARNTGHFSNLFCAYRKCKGDYLVYLADDDSLIAPAIKSYINRLNEDTSLAAVYADWIAFDDEKSIEMHRYYRFQNPIQFQKDQQLEIVNFALMNKIFPEMAIFRRDAVIDSYFPISLQYPFFVWLYNVSKKGSIVFEKTPFYREHRVLKPHLTRNGTWENMSIQLQLIGDEMRIALENIFQQIMIDRNISKFSDSEQLTIKNLIDSYLHDRTHLEIQRAVQKKNWILAVELKRRLLLWAGTGSESHQNLFLNLTFPASLQAVNQYAFGICGIDRIVFSGSRLENAFLLFKQTFPEINCELRTNPILESVNHELFVVENDFECDRYRSSVSFPGHVINFESLLNCYRLSQSRIVI